MPRALPVPVRTLIIAPSAQRRTSLKKSLQGGASVEVIGVLPGTAEARAYLQDWRPHAVLIDLESTATPAEIESVLEICSDGAFDIPVVLLVDYLEPAATARVLRSGVSSILQRDSSPEQIAAAIRGSAEELVVLSPETLDDILAEHGTHTADLEPLIEELTPRELEVLRMAAAGLGNRDIAARLGISEHTIKFHISSVLGKLGAASRTEAVAHGIKRGLVLL